LNEVEVALGGMVEISLRVPVRCAKCGAVAAKTCARCEGSGVGEELFSAWLAVRPGVADGTVLQPSAWLPGMLERVYFRVRVSVGAAGEES
jgi:DnaJ-class molecular chaperone